MLVHDHKRFHHSLPVNFSSESVLCRFTAIAMYGFLDNLFLLYLCDKQPFVLVHDHRPFHLYQPVNFSPSESVLCRFQCEFAWRRLFYSISVTLTLCDHRPFHCLTPGNFSLFESIVYQPAARYRL